MRTWGAAGVFALCLAVACAQSSPPLTVFAASSLAAPLEELAALHEMRGGGKVRLHLGASGTLAQQLREGAPADVLVVADERLLPPLIAERLAEASSEAVVATNRLVVVGAPGLTLSSRAQLFDGTLRIGVGDPDAVPVGRYAREWLVHERRWDQLVASRRLVTAPSAQAVVAQVATGATDAAVVFRTDVTSSNGLRVIYDVPPDATAPIRYVGVLTRGGARRTDAALFLDLLTGGEGQPVFADSGFGTARPR